jgi:signal transduction histidine kinase
MATVLCVDDDRAGLETVARVLREVASVETARSAAEAETALAPEVAVVVSDYRMPGTNGAALLAAVRARDETIGRILLTAYADAEILMEAINRGNVHRYLAKPWDPRELRAAVRHAISAAETARERRRLADEIARAYERLRETDALKTRFLTVAAHELRTPLHVLGGVLEALADVAEVRREAADLLTVAQRNLEWLRRSVRAMTDLARLAQPERRPPARLCVATIVTRAVAEVESCCGLRRLALVREIDMPAIVRGDVADLHHAVMNLLLNAVRFTPDGGTIRVGVQRDPDRVRVVVADSGIGIAAAARDRIGEPFFTAAPADHHHSDPIAFGGGGIGLGLAVARAVAADHRGRLSFESEPGRGSTFVLELPAVADASP